MGFYTAGVYINWALVPQDAIPCSILGTYAAALLKLDSVYMHEVPLIQLYFASLNISLYCLLSVG